MGGKSQSVIFRAARWLDTRIEIWIAYRSFRRAHGRPSLYEKYVFKGSCASIMEAVGFIPPAYPDKAAEYMKQYGAVYVPATVSPLSREVH